MKTVICSALQTSEMYASIILPPGFAPMLNICNYKFIFLIVQAIIISLKNHIHAVHKTLS